MDITQDILKYGSRVLTPEGEGSAIAVDTSKNPREYLVAFLRSNFSPAAWVRMSPANGPSVYRMYPENQLTVPLPKAEQGKEKKYA